MIFISGSSEYNSFCVIYILIVILCYCLKDTLDSKWFNIKTTKKQGEKGENEGQMVEKHWNKRVI